MIHSVILSPKIALIAVEFDGKASSREVKEFKDNFKAKAFYIKMSKEGKNPSIKKAVLK